MSDSEDLDSDVEGSMELDENLEEAEAGSSEAGSSEATGSEAAGSGAAGSGEGSDSSSSSSDDSDNSNDDEDDDAERKMINKYLEILTKISEDKYNYDNYVELVDTAQYVPYILIHLFGQPVTVRNHG